jgi:hypothetical protein
MMGLTISPRWLLTLASLCVLTITGCGADDLGRRYSVSGTVTYKGQPVEKGTITFTPSDANGRVATGTIENGKYTLSTLGDNDGALPGKYMVSMSAREIDLSIAEKNAEKTGGMLRQDDVAKAYAKAKMDIPAKYELAETSGLTATVEQKSNTINFELQD